MGLDRDDNEAVQTRQDEPRVIKNDCLNMIKKFGVLVAYPGGVVSISLSLATGGIDGLKRFKSTTTAVYRHLPTHESPNTKISTVQNKQQTKRYIDSSFSQLPDIGNNSVFDVELIDFMAFPHRLGESRHRLSVRPRLPLSRRDLTSSIG